MNTKITYDIQGPNYVAVTGKADDAADLVVTNAGPKSPEEADKVRADIHAWTAKHHQRTSVVAVTCNGKTYTVKKNIRERRVAAPVDSGKNN